MVEAAAISSSLFTASQALLPLVYHCATHISDGSRRVSVGLPFYNTSTSSLLGNRLLLCVFRGPLLGSCDSGLLVLLPALGNIGSEGIIWIRSAEKGLNGEKDGPDLQSGRPVVLEDVKADTAKFVDVGMEDLGKKSDLGRRHGVVIGEEEFELEDAAFIRRLGGPMDLDVKVSQVFFVRHGADTRNGFSHQPLSFLDDSFWQRHPGRWVYEVNRRNRALR